MKTMHTFVEHSFELTAQARSYKCTLILTGSQFKWEKPDLTLKQGLGMFELCTKSRNFATVLASYQFVFMYEAGAGTQ